VLIALAGIVAVTVLVIAAWQIGSSDESPPAVEPAPAAPTESRAAEPPAATAGEPTPEPLAGASLLITATAGPSLIEARRGSGAGELLFEGTIARGQTQALEARRIWLFLAKPQNVELELNGNDVQLVPAGPGPAAFLVTAAGIRPAGGS
jgi:hypothetical protein